MSANWLAIGLHPASPSELSILDLFPPFIGIEDSLLPAHQVSLQRNSGNLSLLPLAPPDPAL
jgi:hypothetical protein